MERPTEGGGAPPRVHVARALTGGRTLPAEAMSGLLDAMLRETFGVPAAAVVLQDITARGTVEVVPGVVTRPGSLAVFLFADPRAARAARDHAEAVARAGFGGGVADA